MVIVCKNNFEWTIIIATCYFEPCCQGEYHIEELGCCGFDGTNPCGYKSGEDVGVPCFEVVCP